MGVRIDSDVQIAAITFMQRQVLLLTVSDVIVNGFVKGRGQFLNTFAFEVDQSVDTFYFTEEYGIFFKKFTVL